MAAFANVKTHHLAAAILFISFVIISSGPSSSSARLLNDYLPRALRAATEPALNLALPSDSAVDADKHAFLPCDDMAAGWGHRNNAVAEGVEAVKPPRLAGKYGPMILNILPKGVPIPPSGPSKGINDGKN